ncbi:MAG TPA: ATP-binding protein [Bacteroidia bacterium]|nr:ATP-binding protein [Bacteroidia bacterium]
MDAMESQNILKIAVIGAESTGKTALCESLALHFNTTWVPEFARTYFNNSDIYNYSLRDLEIIALKQLEDERRALAQAQSLLFCDTALITLRIWAELEFGTCPEIILRAMKHTRYHLYLVTSNEVPWEADDQRQNKFSRELILQRNLDMIQAEETPYQMVRGLGTERISSAIVSINAFLNTVKG